VQRATTESTDYKWVALEKTDLKYGLQPANGAINRLICYI